MGECLSFHCQSYARPKKKTSTAPPTMIMDGPIHLRTPITAEKLLMVSSILRTRSSSLSRRGSMLTGVCCCCPGGGILSLTAIAL